MNHIREDKEMFAQLQTAFRTALRDFDSSAATFKVLRSFPEQSQPRCRTLYVLDSSFNPPSRAHALLAKNAIGKDKGAHPARLLLLLATTNADKAVKPAAFEDRLAMMTLMAQQLYGATDHTPVDVGVTKKPFFVDKAKSIDDSGIYGGTEQVHVTGFDTITRIFDAKYYPADQKLSVLNPFLTRHRLRVNYRLGDKYGDRKEQDKYLEGISNGTREHEGMRSEWRERIEMVSDAEEGAGISSTQARKAAVEKDPDQAVKFVDEAICEYMKEMELYIHDDTSY